MKTKLAVIGDPIAHSLSPCIHIPVLESQCEDWDYEKIRVEKGRLAEFLRSEKTRQLCGFNVTMPHKMDIIPFLDGIDDEAERYKAVNTVKVTNGGLFGYNTDGEGCRRAVEERGHSFCNSRVVILGAGGVASTAALKAVSSGAAAITVLNRTRSAVYDLAENVKNRCGLSIDIGGLTTEEISAACEKCDILINCTPLGMHGVKEDFSDLSFLERLNSRALVFDMIYNPPETSFLRYARECGLETMNGLDMLIYQGLVADEIFLEKSLAFAEFKEKIILNSEKMKK